MVNFCIFVLVLSFDFQANVYSKSVENTMALTSYFFFYEKRGFIDLFETGMLLALPLPLGQLDIGWSVMLRWNKYYMIGLNVVRFEIDLSWSICTLLLAHTNYSSYWTIVEANVFKNRTMFLWFIIVDQWAKCWTIII